MNDRFHHSSTLTRRSFVGATLSTIWTGTRAQQEAGPAFSRPITIYVPAVPGGSAEQEMRTYALRASELAGQPIVFEHRPGAGGTLAANLVARAKPDGYTLLQATGDLTTAPLLFKQLPFNPITDFSHVSVLGRRTAVLLVHPAFPARTAKEYFEYARANPSKINFGSVGATARLGAEWLHYEADVKVTMVDYKGTGSMLPDLLAGRLQATMLTPLSSKAHVTSGALRALGVSSAERLPLWPELPPLAEQGAGAYDFYTWTGIVAPANTPPSMVARLNYIFTQAARSKTVRDKLDAEYIQLVAANPRDSEQFLKNQLDKFRSIPGLATALASER